MKKLILTACLLLANLASANTVYTIGDPASFLLARMFFESSPVIQKPGAEGVLLWHDVLADPGAVSLQPPQSVHVASIVHSDFASKATLIGVVAKSNMYLMAPKKLGVQSLEDMKKKQYSVATLGENGICANLLRKIQEERGIDLVIVPYKSVAKSQADFLGGHVDMQCAGGVSAHETLKTGEFSVVMDMKRDFGFSIRTYVYVNNAVPQETKQALVKSLHKQLSNADKDTLVQSGLELDVHTGEEAQLIFTKERTFFRKIFANRISK